MKKVVFGITSLDIGGAEKVLVDLCNKLQKSYDITIFTIYGNGELESSLHKNIKLISLYDKRYKDYNFIERKRKSLLFSSKPFLKHIYNKYIASKYDIEIAFLEGAVTSLFAFSNNKNKIAWVHTNISMHINNVLRKKQYEKDYKKYKKIIFVSKDALNGFNELFNINADKKIIYNYMDTSKLIKRANSFEVGELNAENKEPIFLVVCRLVKAKGLDRLALVSKKLLEDGLNHKIFIVGDGPEKDNIMTLIERYDIKNNFMLLGKKDNPMPYIKACDYFILPSIYEGFGMVLIEAMCLNKKIIITDTGAKEAVDGYDNKIVVENSFDGLYDGMKKVISKKVKFKKEPKNPYDESKIIKKIKSLLEGEL